MSDLVGNPEDRFFYTTRLKYPTETVEHYDNTSIQYTENFRTVKIGNFHLKNYENFLIFAQNINCGYTLEAPQ